MALFSAIAARWQLAAGLAALLIASHGLAYCEGREDGKEASEARQAALDLKAAQKARKADAAASQAVKGTTDNVEQGNQRAREAGGDDPLGAGLRSLRAETRPNAPAR